MAEFDWLLQREQRQVKYKREKKIMKKKQQPWSRDR